MAYSMSLQHKPSRTACASLCLADKLFHTLRGEKQLNERVFSHL